MDERELEAILQAAGREEFAPPERLRRAMTVRARGTRLLRVAVFASLLLHWVACGGVLLVLLSPEVTAVVKVYVAAGSIAIAGALTVVIVAARRPIVEFLERFECLAGHCAGH